MEDSKYVNLSVAVVALVAVAGLVLTQSNNMAGAVTQNSMLDASNEFFDLGLGVGYSCMQSPSYDLHSDEWRYCCGINCQDVCEGKKVRIGLSDIDNCQANCKSGCRQAIRRSIELAPEAFR